MGRHLLFHKYGITQYPPPSEDLKLLIWLVFQRFLYRQLMYYVAIKSTLTAIRGTVVGWGKLERKATVPMGR